MNLKIYIKSIREQYPAYVSKEQLYKICHISKQSAKLLLDYGIIPCENLGKKTRKYRIRLDDIITYMEQRELAGNKYPIGMRPKSKYIPLKKLPENIDMEMFSVYFANLYEEYPDVLNVQQVSEMIGYSSQFVIRTIQGDYLYAFLIRNSYHIPKLCVIDLMATKRYHSVVNKSKKYIRLLIGFEQWKKSNYHVDFN